MPGGKLVVADLDVVDGRLADVSVHGDFFLEPDEALEDINAALTGLSQDASQGEIVAALDAARALVETKVATPGWIARVP